jgi:hypothetical protein
MAHVCVGWGVTCGKCSGQPGRREAVWQGSWEARTMCHILSWRTEEALLGPRVLGKTFSQNNITTVQLRYC